MSLPPHQRETLIRWLTEENVDYPEARDRLWNDFGVKTSRTALSHFYATQCFSLRYSEAGEMADTVATEMAARPDKFDEATIALVRQKTFERAVARDGNLDELAILAKILHDSAKLRLKERDQQLTERRLQLLEKKAAQADAAENVTRDSALTPAEREAKLKEIFGLR